MDGEEFDSEARAGLVAGGTLFAGVLAAAVSVLAFDGAWLPILGVAFALTYGVLGVFAARAEEYRKAIGQVVSGMGWLLLWTHSSDRLFWVGLGALFVGVAVVLTANGLPTAFGEGATRR